MLIAFPLVKCKHGLALSRAKIANNSVLFADFATFNAEKSKIYQISAILTALP